MSHDWVITVLNDLRAFAMMNGMPVLAQSLDDARVVAETEMQGRLPGDLRAASRHAARQD
ncbi:MAG: hypothetical protein KDK26_08940 [Roseivivax sp.]|nr:hypothetical protein [Roseivivax sp.]